MAVLVVLPLDVMCGVCSKPGCHMELQLPEELEAGTTPKVPTEITCGNCGATSILGDVPARVESLE